MGLFNLFKKDNKNTNNSTDNGVLGPSFLQDFTTNILNPKDLKSHEWRRQLKTPAGQTKFRIKYYGQLHDKYPNLIVGNDFVPTRLLAIDIASGQEILLFDGCKHGYNAMFCDTYTSEQIQNRPADKVYKDTKGNELFEIIISTYNGIDYEEEFSNELDDNGLIEIIDGSKIKVEEAKRNGFDTLQIFATNESGETFKIVSAELA